MFREDNSHTHTHTHTRRDGAAEVMNVFRKPALDTIKLNKTHKASMKRKLKMAALDDDFKAELLLGRDN